MSNNARPGAAFGALLRRHRSLAGWTQEEVARRSGLSLRALSDMERGRTARPFLRSARLLADALELDAPARAELMSALYAGADPPASARGRDEELPRPEVPCQLPAPVRHFTGRGGELQALTRLLRQDGEETSGTVVIAGTAGVGKTALAVHAAHRVADRFPDGQLYVNLRGYDPDQPVQAGDALAGFLRAMGVADSDIPAAIEERAARYRSVLAGRRLLVLLDNASSARQVRPLLPGGPSCLTLVTSRSALAGLVAREGAHRLELDLLPAAEAAGLLCALIGERAAASPEATAALAGQCARLPLALRVAAELAVAAPAVAVADLVAELADHRRRLELLDADGDAQTAVRAVFSWSVRRLDPGTARAFRLLGLHPGTEFDVHSAGALIGTSAERAQRILGQLARAYLIQQARRGWYSMHDLLRAYAAGLAAERDSKHYLKTALTRLFDHYLAAATAAANVMFPADPDRPPAPAVDGPLPVSSPAAARSWAEAHRASLVAMTAYAASHGWPGHAISLADTVFRYPDTGHFADAAAVHGHACSAAAQTGNARARASALHSLGVAETAQGYLPKAIGHFQDALALCRETGEQAGEARALVSLGHASYCAGRYEDAITYDRQALALYRRSENRLGEARALNNLGRIDLRQGRYEQAAAHFGRSLAFLRQAGIKTGEAHVLANLGELEMRRGRRTRAATHLQRSLALCHETGSRLGEARTLARLGFLLLSQGEYEQAMSHLRQSLALSIEDANYSGQAEALNGLGEALLVAGHPQTACALHSDALARAIQARDRYEQARAHDGLAAAYQTTGSAGEASRHRHQAATGYAKLGARWDNAAS